MNKKTQLRREAERLLYPESEKSEVRILVKGELYAVITVTADKSKDIDVTSKEAAEATIKLIKNLNDEVQYFRDGRPMPITGVVIKEKE